MKFISALKPKNAQKEKKKIKIKEKQSKNKIKSSLGTVFEKLVSQFGISALVIKLLNLTSRHCDPFLWLSNYL